MAFLDNSGDIILDAVLTDAGRQRMARGEFKIVKYALSDEEINYKLFNSTHPSGSAFSDLQIMQTPILEAFTNNTSLMKTKLVSINRNNLLYMPIFRSNTKRNPSKPVALTDSFRQIMALQIRYQATRQVFTMVPSVVFLMMRKGLYQLIKA